MSAMAAERLSPDAIAGPIICVASGFARTHRWLPVPLDTGAAPRTEIAQCSWPALPVCYPVRVLPAVCHSFKQESAEGRGWVTGYRVVAVQHHPIGAPAPEFRATPRIPQVDLLRPHRRVLSPLVIWRPTTASAERPMPTPIADMLCWCSAASARLTACRGIPAPSIAVAPCRRLPVANLDGGGKLCCEPLSLTGPLSQPALFGRPILPRPVLRAGGYGGSGPSPADSGPVLVRLAPPLPPPVASALALPQFRMALVSRRLSEPAGGLRAPLVLAPATPQPPAGWSPAIRLGTVTTPSPSGAGIWRRPGPVVCHKPPQAASSPAAPLTQGALFHDSAIPVLIPGSRPRVNRRAFVLVAPIRSERHIAEPADAEPLEFLAKGSRLHACEYRTLSMLSGALPKAG